MYLFPGAALALLIAVLPALVEAQQGQSSTDGYYKGSRYGRASNQMRRAEPPADPPKQEVAAPAPSDPMKSATDAALSQILGGATAPPPPADEGRLKQLSEEVVQSIAGFEGEEDKAAALRGQLQGLVREARASGRDDAYVGALIDEASEGRLAEIPAALKTSENRLDTATLLQGSVGEANGGGDEPTSALRPEAAGQTDTAARVDQVTVRPGDTLSVIAARVYGDGLLYGRIFEANRDVLSSPDKIRVGQRLRTPR